tara:strand:- start:7825 stop:8208 length:384 start_codon:yes stop_codon:yes gene_type:complete
MELADIADWFDDIETSLQRIKMNGGVDIFTGDANSTEIEINIVNWGGINGYLRYLEQKAIETNTSEDLTKSAIFAYVYNIPTTISINCNNFDHIVSLMPICRKCHEFAPSFLDYPAFKVCSACDTSC